MRRFLINLNYAIGLALIGSYVAAFILVPPLEQFLRFVGIKYRLGDNSTYIAALVVCLAIAAAWIVQKGIVPSPSGSMAEIFLKGGIAVLAVGNGALALAVIVSLVGIALVPQFGLMVGFILAMGLMAAMTLAFIGTICIELARILDCY